MKSLLSSDLLASRGLCLSTVFPPLHPQQETELQRSQLRGAAGLMVEVGEEGETEGAEWDTERV